MTGAATKSLFAVLALTVVGCSSADPEGSERSSVPASSGDAGSGGDAAAKVDPSGGRDDSAASCFAACTNTSYFCQEKGSTKTTTLELSPESTGCSGTLTKAGVATPVKLDCVERTVCIASNCVSGTYSAMSFGYTPTGGVATVCTRD